MSSTTQIKSQRDTQNVPQGPLPSELLPTSVTQPPLIDLTQSLQARTLQEQLKAFVSPDLIKHGEQVLFRPQVTNDVHIITATADIVPKAIITSLTLFLEIQLFMASQSAGFDAQLHAYTPADRMLPTLAQIRCSRPHIKSKVASVESQLASACTQVLNTAQANPKVPLRDHQLQYCRTRLTIALYTSSTILLKVRGRKPDEKAHLSSWQYVEVDEKFLLILKTAEQKTVEKLIKIVSIYSQKDDEEVKLSSLTDEMILIDQIHQSILSGEDAPTTNDRSQGQIVSTVQSYLLS